jgi:hypothetical protein
MDPSPSPPATPHPAAEANDAAAPRAERRLRRKLRDDEQLVAWGRAWVSREGRMHLLFAARTLDFVVLTDDSLIVFSTGFFSRRPRRRVYHELLDRLYASERRVRRGRCIAVWTRGRRPLLFELRDQPRNNDVADRLLEWIRRHEAGMAMVPAEELAGDGSTGAPAGGGQPSTDDPPGARPGAEERAG